jgi:hypothetical protein
MHSHEKLNYKNMTSNIMIEKHGVKNAVYF